MKSLGTLRTSLLCGTLTLAMGFGIASCSDASDTEQDMAQAPDMAAAAPEPIEYYRGSLSAKLGAQGNQATCATCHSNDGSPRSGNTLKDIAFHTSFKGGGAKTLLEAANACIKGWMGGNALTTTDKAWRELKGYLESISNPSKITPNPLAPEVLADEAAYEAEYKGGDATAGAAKYAKACGSCHDTKLVVGSSPSPGRAVLRGIGVGRIAQQVRTAGPPPSGMMDPSDSTPGPMTFFEPSELSKQDLADIIAYARSASP